VVYFLVLGAHAMRHRWGRAHFYALMGGLTAIMSWITDNTGLWYNRAIKYNFYLRGFKYLHIMQKSESDKNETMGRKIKWTHYERK